MAKTIIKIPYRPRNWAKILHTALTRWIVLVIHRRGGKTTAALNHLIRDAVTKPNTRYAYIAPTFTQAKRIVWAMAKHYTKNVPGVDRNEAELLIKFVNGSELMVLGSDSPDSLRGIALWGCFLDEYPLHSPIVFTEIVTKCLADHLGYCIFGGTPKGKGHFYKVYKVAKDDKDWTLVYRTIDESLKTEDGIVIENLKQALAEDRKLVKQGLMTEDEFMQEWYNSFEAALRGAVYLKELAMLREKKRIVMAAYDPKLPVFTVWDLGIRDAMAIGFYQKLRRQLVMVDYYENTGLGFPHYAKVVKEKHYVYGKHFAPHDIKQKELMSGKTRISTADDLGITFEIIPSISIEDGIDLGRALFHHLIVDGTACDVWLELIPQYVYERDEKKQTNKPKPLHNFASNAADVHRYAAIVEDQMEIEDTPEDEAEVGWEDDEFVGQEDSEERKEGYGKSRMMRDVNIGELGHKKGV